MKAKRAAVVGYRAGCCLARASGVEEGRRAGRAWSSGPVREERGREEEGASWAAEQRAKARKTGKMGREGRQAASKPGQEGKGEEGRAKMRDEFFLFFQILFLFLIQNNFKYELNQVQILFKIHFLIQT